MVWRPSTSDRKRYRTCGTKTRCASVPDLYKALDLPHDCTLADIKAAYRTLARKNHPDMSKAAGAEERFKNIAAAYAILKDPIKRAEYDESLLPPKAPAWSHGGGGMDGGMDSHPFDDMDLAGLMEAMGRGNAQRSRTAARAGEDVEHSVHVTLAQANAGTTLQLDVMDGTAPRLLEVKIPAGVVEGRRVRLAGLGGKGRGGGANGHIYLHVHLKADKVFTPQGHDLYFDLRLSPWEAMLGAQVQVPTLESDVMLTVPPFTRAAQTLRLKGRGMHDGKGGSGDLYARVSIVVPGSLTEPEVTLVQQLSKLSTFAPRAA